MLVVEVMIQLFRKSKVLIPDQPYRLMIACRRAWYDLIRCKVTGQNYAIMASVAKHVTHKPYLLSHMQPNEEFLALSGHTRDSFLF